MNEQTDFDEPTLIRVLFCIAQHVRQHGYSQTYAQLGEACNLSAGGAWPVLAREFTTFVRVASRAKTNVRALERRGLVVIPKWRRPRGIQLARRVE